MARLTSRRNNARLCSGPAYLLFLTAAVSSFTSCLKPNSGNLSSGTEADSTDNPKRGLGMDKETFKKTLAQDIETLKGNINGCPSFPRSGKKLVLEQSKFIGFIPRGSRMDINTSENRTIGSIDAPFGSAFAGRGKYYTYHMTNESGAVTSYARFKKTGLDDNFQLDYMTPPEVEVYSCSVTEEALKNAADTGQLPIYRFRVNSVNGSRYIQMLLTVKTLKKLFGPVCSRSAKLRKLFGDECDSLPLYALVALPSEQTRSLAVEVPEGGRAYAGVFLSKKKTIDSIITVSKDAKTIRVQDLEKTKAPTDSGSEQDSAAQLTPPANSLVELWLPYFFRAEQHLESYNSKLDTALGLAVDLTIGLVPGGKYLGEGVWMLAEEALSKGAESVRQENLQSNPNADESSSPSP